jgi:hypothetical protein
MLRGESSAVEPIIQLSVTEESQHHQSSPLAASSSSGIIPYIEFVSPQDKPKFMAERLQWLQKLNPNIKPEKLNAVAEKIYTLYMKANFDPHEELEALEQCELDAELYEFLAAKLYENGDVNSAFNFFEISRNGYLSHKNIYDSKIIVTFLFRYSFILFKMQQNGAARVNLLAAIDLDPLIKVLTSDQKEFVCHKIQDNIYHSMGHQANLLSASSHIVFAESFTKNSDDMDKWDSSCFRPAIEAYSVAQWLITSDIDKRMDGEKILQQIDSEKQKLKNFFKKEKSQNSSASAASTASSSSSPCAENIEKTKTILYIDLYAALCRANKELPEDRLKAAVDLVYEVIDKTETSSTYSRGKLIGMLEKASKLCKLDAGTTIVYSDLLINHKQYGKVIKLLNNCVLPVKQCNSIIESHH